VETFFFFSSLARFFTLVLCTVAEMLVEMHEEEGGKKVVPNL